MPLVITDMSALRYYRFAKAGLVPEPQPCDVRGLDCATATLKGIDPSDLAWRHIAPHLLAERGVIARAAVEPGLAVAAEHHFVPNKEALYDLERAPVDDGDLHCQVLRNLVKWSRSALAAYDPTALQAGSLLSDQLGYEFPRLDLMVREDAKSRSKAAIAHMWSGDLPDGALMRINDSTLVVSPELLLTRLSILRPDAPHVLAALGLELAGRYALLPKGYVDCSKLIDEGRELVSSEGRLLGDGYVSAKSLLDVDRLDAFFAQVTAKRGRHAREVAMPRIFAGSESPLESNSNVSLVFPRLSGGFSAGKAELNAEVRLSADARALCNGARVCRLDQLFVGRGGRRVDFEPGGDAWHRGMAWKKDNNRRQALEHDGYEVVAVSWDEFVDFARWSMLAESVARSLGRCTRQASERTRERQARVHADLVDLDVLRDAFG